MANLSLVVSIHGISSTNGQSSGSYNQLPDYTIVMSQLPRIHSECEYIARYNNSKIISHSLFYTHFYSVS